MDRYNKRIDHNSINNHRNNHLLPLEQGSDIIKMLYNTGNSRLARAIIRTQKIIKKCYKWVCEVSDRSVKRKGVVYICQLCKGWVEGEIGRSINKRKWTKNRKEERISISASIKPKCYW